MERLTDHLIVISFDCLSSLDFTTIKEMPHFKELMNKGSYCTNVKTIYPSVTYPCHATIVTGNYPKKHGVINNTHLQPGSTSPDWYWHRHHIKGTTLYDEAKQKGLTTAALLWPVTAKANIDYNMPEIFANRPWHHQIAVSLWNGSTSFQLEMNRRFGHIRNGLFQPQLDDFVLESAVETIRKKKPNLMLVHFTDLDSHRHYHGFSSEEAHNALKRHDERLGRIVAALREAGIHDNSTIVALGDHSALDESKAIKPNVLLKQEGLLHVNAQGKVTDWKAYCKSCDGSAYIYVKDPNDQETMKNVKDLLFKLIKDKKNGLENILTGKEAGERGADETCAFMLEASLDFYITEGLQGSYLDEITPEDVETGKYTFASHGYSPAKPDYETILMAYGKGIKEGSEIPSMNLIDEGPTFARLLGLDLGETDGKSVKELLDL
ncbi:alkaline phosphatase family protein [Bacillus salacetis]|uniref:alkaline phosphatase family protein n=1 Tax=Bacillus salacetis TaxID=2315464 RepID=UPI003BA06677